jgi:GT2 family glycosyltransferase
MRIHLIVLNFNGRKLLETCLPSIVEASAASRHDSRVVVIDNSSTDDSVDWLRREFSGVFVVRSPNLGLASYNRVVAELGGDAAILLNNDVQLELRSVDRLVKPLEDRTGGCFLSTPLCWRFDGTTYEGLKTSVRWKWGLVQATALYDGHEAGMLLPGFTASAGAVMAVDCARFVALGGFDPLYWPGRLEDLDFALRGFMAGWHARYVPEAVSWHFGQATFDAELGKEATGELALRNTLLFQWKNLRHPAHVAFQVAGLPVRLAWDWARSMRIRPARKWILTRALMAALRQWRAVGPGALSHNSGRERQFFRCFSPRRIDKLIEADVVSPGRRPALRACGAEVTVAEPACGEAFDSSDPSACSGASR